MPGYWNQPEETANAFVGRFFRTGDVGYMDAEGFIFIVDRIKDMINASGFKVYPRRIEDALYEHPAVAEVTVIGIPDAYRGEAPKAFIKLKDGETATDRRSCSTSCGRSSPRSNCRPRSSSAISCPRPWWASIRSGSCAPSGALAGSPKLSSARIRLRRNHHGRTLAPPGHALPIDRA